ncbi:hypothetical protein B9Z55_018661 [Caenorhabditis nigoni]|uniref:G-protein coupled receptors family 1 profile domain-containing protein n=2 Tax=Caenorhabditis nigoni TaxID=1611254 RepID=A0A2G5TEZ4_9PELO|nr:hypothetical protein B9Z55_018661 [Caenorhabditis nigoni]
MSNQTDCEQMAQVATSSALRLVLSITTILCFLCIPSCLYCLWRIQRSTKLHFNSKCIFITHNIFILIHMTVRITLHGKDLLNYFGPWISGCEIFPSRTRCELRIIYKLSAYVVEVSPFILTAERFMATFQARHYENRFKWFGLLLNVLHICIAVLFLWLQSSGNFGEIIIYYCWLASTGNRYYLNIPIFLVVISQLVTIPALLYLLKKNERFRETSLGKHATLTQRYQIFENLRTLNMFRIMSIITWIYVTYNAAATYIANMYLKSMSMDRQFAYIEVVHCLPFYYLALSFFIYREDRKPRSQFVIKVTNYEPNYFNDLQRFFDDAFVKIKPTHPKH